MVVQVNYWVYGDPHEPTPVSHWYMDTEPIEGLTEALSKYYEEDPLQLGSYLWDNHYHHRCTVKGYIFDEPWLAYESKSKEATYRFLLIPVHNIQGTHIDVIMISNLPDFLMFLHMIGDIPLNLRPIDEDDKDDR